MKKILFPILMILFVVGGAIGADFLRNSAGDTSKSEHSSKKSAKKSSKGDKGHGKKDSHKKKKDHKKDKGHKKSSKKKDGHGGDKDGYGDSAGIDAITYLKFKRQFVVPVMHDGAIEALVIMNFNLELDGHAPDNVYTYEPKLRDAITRELLGLSNAGLFGNNLTSAESYETIRSTLLSASQAVINEGIKDILILDVARQEQ